MRARSAAGRAALACVLLVTGACSADAPWIPARGVPATAHEQYAEALVRAGLDSTAMGQEWLAAGDSALRAPLRAVLPMQEVGVYARGEARAVAFRVTLRDGERLRATLRADGLPARLFLDLFEVVEDTARPFVHVAEGAPASATDSTADSITTSLGVEYEASRDIDVIVRLQPELLRSGRYELTFAAEPVLAFPVEGHGNRAIQSFFGANRDGGRRVHHGIDIFAPRGTPVLAATDGVVRGTDPNNLGGNVVWLRDEQREQTLYYAHLDTQIVVAGQRVQTGDTLGFVGNTGNARTTPPHLHFGIYRRGRGPVDPLPAVRLVTQQPTAPRVDTALLGARAATSTANAPLHEAADGTGTIELRVARATGLAIMGASGRRYRVQFDDGTTGYLAASAVRVLADQDEARSLVAAGSFGTAAASEPASVAPVGGGSSGGGAAR